jgi:hypothetical protein
MNAPQHQNDRPEYVSLWPSDWLGGAATLPAMAEWTYWQISLYCMDKGEPVPAKRIAMIMIRHGGDWQADIDLLIDLGKVHKTNSGGLFVKRSLAEYQRADEALQKKRNAGAAGARKRWGNSDVDSIANGSAMDRKPDDQTGKPVRIDMLDTIKPDIWKAFVKMRVTVKAPLSDHAADLIRKKLFKIFEEHGHDPNEVLNQSTMFSWKGVFPLKQENSGNGKRSGWRMSDEQ